MTGGVHRAARGEITVLVGGPEGVVARRRLALEAMHSPMPHIGALGSVATLELVTNMPAVVPLKAVGKALALCARPSIDLATAFEGIRASSGNSFAHETESRMLLAGS